MELHMATVIEQIAQVTGDHPAIVQNGTTTTWREFDDQASRLASVLWDHGLRRTARSVST